MEPIDQILIEERAEITVELKPHIGTTETPLGPFQEELDQWMVYCHSSAVSDPVFIGYLPKAPTGKFCPYTTWNKFPKKLQDSLMTKISEKAGGERKLGNVPLDPNSELGRQFLRTGTIPDKTDDEGDPDDTETVDE